MCRGRTKKQSCCGNEGPAWGWSQVLSPYLVQIIGRIFHLWTDDCTSFERREGTLSIGSSKNEEPCAEVAILYWGRNFTDDEATLPSTYTRKILWVLYMFFVQQWLFLRPYGLCVSSSSQLCNREFSQGICRSMQSSDRCEHQREISWPEAWWLCSSLQWSFQDSERAQVGC